MKALKELEGEHASTPREKSSNVQMSDSESEIEASDAEDEDETNEAQQNTVSECLFRMPVNIN